VDHKHWNGRVRTSSAGGSQSLELGVSIGGIHSYSHIEAARSLGLVESALRRWVNQLQEERLGVTPKSKALTPEQQKIQELEARIDRLEREKAILKKATALLMSDEFNRTR
jgi:transposase